MNNTKPLTRGQRKRRLISDRIKRKQDLTAYLLKQKQLENIKSKKKCYNLNKLKDEILNNIVKEDDSQKKKNNKLNRKKMQNIRSTSMNYMKEILEHPDFNKIEDIKSKLLNNIELEIKSNDSKLKNKLKSKNDVKSKKLIKVNKSIRK